MSLNLMVHSIASFVLSLSSPKEHAWVPDWLLEKTEVSYNKSKLIKSCIQCLVLKKYEQGLHLDAKLRWHFQCTSYERVLFLFKIKGGRNFLFQRALANLSGTCLLFLYL